MTFEEVVSATRRIEALLEQCGANGRGLHEKTTSIESRLSEPTRSQLRFIATLRNRLVHEQNVTPDETTVQRFRKAVEDVTGYLEAMSPLTSLKAEVARLQHEIAALREMNENLTKRVSAFRRVGDIDYEIKSKREQLEGIKKAIAEAQSELFRLKCEKNTL